jgi:hypothetical protein
VLLAAIMDAVYTQPKPPAVIFRLKVHSKCIQTSCCPVLQEVLGKIHQTYRIQYLKDVILPRSLDDATYGTLSSLMLFNNVDVVLGLYQDQKFLPAVRHTRVLFLYVAWPAEHAVWHRAPDG